MRAPDWLIRAPVAHRGLHNIAQGVVENTASAFTQAMARNFSIETDLQLSADGEAMVTHDYELGRLTEGSGAVLSMTAQQLREVRFKHTDDRMISLGDLFTLVDGKVPLVLELKSYFDGSTKLIDRVGELVRDYHGPVALMSFDPDIVQAIRERIPHAVRGIVAEQRYDDAEWQVLSERQRRAMMGLRHIWRTRPHFVAYSIQDMPAPAPLIARHLFQLPLLTWTVRTKAQSDRARRYADQIIFEGHEPLGLSAPLSLIGQHT